MGFRYCVALYILYILSLSILILAYGLAHGVKGRVRNFSIVSNDIPYSVVKGNEFDTQEDQIHSYRCQVSIPLYHSR